MICRNPFVRSLALTLLASTVLFAQSNSKPQSDDETHHVEKIVDTAFTVDAGKVSVYKFQVPADATKVKLTGHFAATGGARNSIEVFVTDEDGLANLKNRHKYRKFYYSGRVTQNSINIPLPAALDTYYLVFDNRFAIMVPKAIKASATVVYQQEPQQASK